MIFITEGFFEVAIESWPEWDLNDYFIYIGKYLSNACGRRKGNFPKSLVSALRIC